MEKTLRKNSVLNQLKENLANGYETSAGNYRIPMYGRSNYSYFLIRPDGTCTRRYTAKWMKRISIPNGFFA